MYHAKVLAMQLLKVNFGEEENRKQFFKNYLLIRGSFFILSNDSSKVERNFMLSPRSTLIECKGVIFLVTKSVFMESFCPGTL